VAEQGERMIRYVGAKQLNDGINRKDGLPVYGRVVTPGFLSRAAATMERCLNSRVVQMNLDFMPSVDHTQTIPTFDEALGKKFTRPWAVALNPRTYFTETMFSAIASLRDKVSSAFSGIFGFMNQHRIGGLSMSITLVTIASAALLMTYTVFELDHFLEIDHLIFVYLIPIFLIAIRYGKGHAAVALVASVLGAAFVFKPAESSLYIDDAEDILELVCFCGIALLICQFFSERPILAWIRQR
jgi:hypothetical protein